MKNVLLLIITIAMSCGQVFSQVEIDNAVILTGVDGTRAVRELELPVNGTDAANKDYVDSLANSGSTHYVGELYGGGIVVAVWGEADEQHGLIVSLTNLLTSTNAYTMEWSGNTSTSVAAAQSLSDGRGNTAAIVSDNSTPDKAATVCDSYVNTETGTGVYSDWYLPSIQELTILYESMNLVNFILLESNDFLEINLLTSDYWSSTEFSFNNTKAMYCVFQPSYYVSSNLSKSISLRVRAFRQF